MSRLKLITILTIFSFNFVLSKDSMYMVDIRTNNNQEKVFTKNPYKKPITINSIFSLNTCVLFFIPVQLLLSVFMYIDANNQKKSFANLQSGLNTEVEISNTLKIAIDRFTESNRYLECLLLTNSDISICQKSNLLRILEESNIEVSAQNYSQDNTFVYLMVIFSTLSTVLIFTSTGMKNLLKAAYTNIKSFFKKHEEIRIFDEEMNEPDEL